MKFVLNFSVCYERSQVPRECVSAGNKFSTNFIPFQWLRLICGLITIVSVTIIIFVQAVHFLSRPISVIKPFPSSLDDFLPWKVSGQFNALYYFPSLIVKWSNVSYVFFNLAFRHLPNLGLVGDDGSYFKIGVGLAFLSVAGLMLFRYVRQQQI